MAIFTTYASSMNLIGQPIYSQSQISSATEHQVILSNLAGIQLGLIGSELTYQNQWLSGGKITQVVLMNNGQTIFEITDFPESETTAAQFVIDTSNYDDPYFLYEHILRFDDILVGSPGGDHLYGFDGNDVFYATTGVDFYDGGSGLDKVYISGNASDYHLGLIGGSLLDLQITLQGNPLESLNAVRIERLVWSGDEAFATDVDGAAGSAYRMYQAAFNRTPDKGGLGYWIAQVDKGLSLNDVAGAFLLSDEFRGIYGNSPTPEDLVYDLYFNILQRAPEQAGYDYWVDIIKTGAATDAQVLALFAESAENKGLVDPVLYANGIWYDEFTII